jgi:hypothetical protein
MTTTIVTRATKGSELSWTEMDANFNNLKATADGAAGTAAAASTAASAAVNSGSNSDAANVFNLAANGVLAPAQSGKIILVNGNLTLPAPFLGGNYLLNRRNVACTMTTPAGLIYDSSNGGGGLTYTLPGSGWFTLYLVWSDGSNWIVKL